MNNIIKERVITSIFSNINSADAAFQAAISHGYKPEEINVLMSNETKSKNYTGKLVQTEIQDKSIDGLAIGGTLGGSALGLIGAFVALSTTIVIPGIELVIAGPLAAGLVGAGAGSIAGGIIGALIGAGMSEDKATFYEESIKKGDIIIAVPARSKELNDKLLKEWEKNNGKIIL